MPKVIWNGSSTAAHPRFRPAWRKSTEIRKSRNAKKNGRRRKLQGFGPRRQAANPRYGLQHATVLTMTSSPRWSSKLLEGRTRAVESCRNHKCDGHKRQNAEDQALLRFPVESDKVLRGMPNHKCDGHKREDHGGAGPPAVPDARGGIRTHAFRGRLRPERSALDRSATLANIKLAELDRLAPQRSGDLM